MTDPLFVIFEQHLFNFQDSESDRRTFVSTIVQEYISYLRRNKVAIPKNLEASVAEELAQQVNTMLLKRIYGCLSIEEFRNKTPKIQKKRAKTRYSSLATQKKKAG